MTEIAIPAENRQPAIDALGRFLLAFSPGKELSVEVELVKAERSSRQNKALFGHAYKVIGQAVGLSGRKELEGLHEDFCKAFYGKRTVSVLGELQSLPVRTTTTDENGKRDVISAAEFSQFYADVERKAAEFGIFIPAPNPRWFLDNENWSEPA